MKKIILSIIVILISGVSLTTYAYNLKLNNKMSCTNTKEELNMDFELLPSMETKSNAKNQAWVGTFQLVWNDLIDELIKQPVEFVGYKSTIAEELNKKSFEINDISENAYYKKYGLVSQHLKTEIEQGIRTKFNEKSDILDLLDWTPSEEKYLLYAMIKKDFEFIEHFKKLGKNVFYGSTEDVEYFGLESYGDYKTRNSINVLFYNNDKDFAISLKSKQGDIVYLYRTDEDKTLDKYYNDMKNKESKFIGIKNFEKTDAFKVPVLDLKSERNFEELCNKQIKNSHYIISKAIETVQLKMDEAGVKLKSEAVIEEFESALMPSDEFFMKPRYFYFNDKYVIFISEEGKKPYFALKVTDAAKLPKK